MLPYSGQERHQRIIQIDFLKQRDGSTDLQYKDDYLNVNSLNLDLTESIYRIFKYDYFLNDLKDRTLTLVRPNTWQDPFENFLLNSRGQLPDGRIVDFQGVRDKFYAQCWSLKEECDGLWRNYKGENKLAIKIKTTTKRLFEGIYDVTNKFHYINYFIGKVDYVSDGEISDFFQNKVDFTSFQSGIEFAQTLLIKRKAFSYEDEVRIIVYHENSSKPSEATS